MKHNALVSFPTQPCAASWPTVPSCLQKMWSVDWWLPLNVLWPWCLSKCDDFKYDCLLPILKTELFFVFFWTLSLLVSTYSLFLSDSIPNGFLLLSVSLPSSRSTVLTWKQVRRWWDSGCTTSWLYCLPRPTKVTESLLHFLSEEIKDLYGRSFKSSNLLLQAASMPSWGSWWQSSHWLTIQPTLPPPCCALSVTMTTVCSWVPGYRRLTTSQLRIRWVKSSMICRF